jgi:hypothetical protein
MMAQLESVPCRMCCALGGGRLTGDQAAGDDPPPHVSVVLPSVETMPRLRCSAFVHKCNFNQSVSCGSC